MCCRIKAEFTNLNYLHTYVSTKRRHINRYGVVEGENQGLKPTIRYGVVEIKALILCFYGLHYRKRKSIEAYASISVEIAQILTMCTRGIAERRKFGESNSPL